MTITTFINSAVNRSRALATADQILPTAERERACSTITSWDAYRRTPLVERPDLAQAVRVGAVLVKDESVRSHLRSFKSLGGAYAVQCAHQRWRAQGFHGDPVVTCVTDGNHGLSVAWGAQRLGIECVIYVPSVVSEARAAVIELYGATVRRIEGNYDEMTRQNADDARRNGWIVVTDTETEEGESNPAVIDVMQGYGVFARELADGLARRKPTHIFLQAGCGGMAGAVLPELMRACPETRFVIVEPERAACLQSSARAGSVQVVGGDLHTRMVGMSVGEVSRPAWDILEAGVDGYAAIGDRYVDQAMRMLAFPSDESSPIESGETGCAGLVTLLELEGADHVRAELGIDSSSTLVLINTEGATDRESYRRIVGEPGPHEEFTVA